MKSILLPLLFILALTTQVAWSHAGNNSPMVVHACIFNTARFVRIIEFNDRCKNYEIATHWNIQGATGSKGLQGIQGAQGIAGKNGNNGINGSKGETGHQGIPGLPGAQGPQGLKGNKGENGNNGKDGANGTDGKSAYLLALDAGYVGELADWLTSLKGETGYIGEQGAPGLPGAQGLQGIDGINGINGHDGAMGAKGDTGIQGPQGLKGDKGETGNNGKDGANGFNGQSAYELAAANGFAGNETDWLASLKGEKGDIGVIEPGACIQNDLTGKWVVFATHENYDVRFTIDIDAKGTLTGTNLYTTSKIPKDGELTGDLLMSDNKEMECFIKLSLTRVGDQSVSILMEGVISPDHHSIIGGGIADSLLTNLRAIRVSPRG